MKEAELKAQIKEAYSEFEGFTGCQEADAILVLTISVCLGTARIESKLEDIYDKLEEIRSEMPDP
jgi:hypothetical protein